MSKRTGTIGLIISVIVAAAVFGIVRIPTGDARTVMAAIAPSTTTTSTMTVPKSVTTTTVPTNANSIANQINGVFQHYRPGEIVTGSNNVQFKGRTESRGIAAFSRRTLKTQQQVGEFLNENTAVSRAAKLRVVDTIRKAGYGDDEVKRALNGTGYFPLQLKVASQILGTTYFMNGKVLEESGQWRQVGPNDIFWMFLTRNGRIIFGATVRADCGNPNVNLVVPVRSNTPPALPIEVPPGQVPPGSPPVCSNGQFVPPNGLCPKMVQFNIDRNPNIPNSVRKTRPSPDNQQQINQGAQRPVDTKDGCPSTCPHTTPTTTGGGSVTVPSCGKPGQPSCDNTGVTPPTTAAPPATTPPTTPVNGTVPSP